MKKISVLADKASHYNIYIDEGIINAPPQEFHDLLAQKSSIFILADEAIAPLYLGDFKAMITKHHKKPFYDIIIKKGEGSKSFATLNILCEEIIAKNVARDSLIIAFGGGVVGDLAGFASAILLRGIDFIQIPTTLLAMVDSSVGGKTGINMIGGKNLVGSFHQPRMVLQDIGLLKSLPERQMKSGYAEIVKYALIDDAVFFAWLDENGKKVIAGDKNALIHAISQSCNAKARIVDEDEKEMGMRMLLNLGHTFGHALEAATGYGDALFHGEAVAIGINMAFHYSMRQGLCAREDCIVLAKHFQKTGLPLWPTDINQLSDKAVFHFDAKQLTDYMRHDKKVKQGQLTLILTQGIGKSFAHGQNDLQDIENFWTDIMAK